MRSDLFARKTIAENNRARPTNGCGPRTQRNHLSAAKAQNRPRGSTGAVERRRGRANKSRRSPISSSAQNRQSANADASAARAAQDVSQPPRATRITTSRYCQLSRRPPVPAMCADRQAGRSSPARPSNVIRIATARDDHGANEHADEQSAAIIERFTRELLSIFVGRRKRIVRSAPPDRSGTYPDHRPLRASGRNCFARCFSGSS